jgi:trehalose/maltose hydrolase-like predicted phosphorylase
LGDNISRAISDQPYRGIGGIMTEHFPMVETHLSHAMRKAIVFLFLACLEWVASGGAAAAVPPAEGWTLEAEKVDPAHYAGVTIANGMIGLLSSSVPFHHDQALINGAYEATRPDEVSSILSTFDPVNTYVLIDGQFIERLDQVTDFRQRLDLKHAVFTTSFAVGTKATVTYRVRALRQLPYSALLDVTVEAKQPIALGAIALLQAPASLRETRTSYRSIELAPEYRVRLAAASARGPAGGLSVAAAQSFIFDEAAKAAPAVAAGSEGLSFNKALPAGTSYHFAVVGSTLTSAHHGDPLNEALRLTAFAALQGTSHLVASHEAAWDDLWRSDIVIEGAEDTQRDIRSMLYHLYSFIREGTSASIPPMGLSRSVMGYNGHIFWDAELWMYPALLVLRPELAKPMLEYRYERLSAARRNAAAHGYAGAMFPWESAATGDEDTPSAALSGVLEHHITADVGIAAWNYYRVTQDRQWLRERGYPLIKETADFWVSRVSRNGPETYDIKNVQAADEYTANVDNDAFTNGAAKANLAAAMAAARVLRLTANPQWEQVRARIPILKFPDGVTREHATYNGETTKQADVNLLAYPLDEISDPAAIRRDLEYSQPRVDHLHGPAMTKSIFSILRQRLGETDEAYQMFRESYQPNQRPPFGVLAESASSQNPYFATGAGGVLQSMLFGFGGLRISDRGIVQTDSRLPAEWKSLTLTGVGPQKRTYTIKAAR